MAVRTERIRLGTMLTPLPWRRPWKVASQAATLDQLSAGRAVLAVGLGWAESGIGDLRDVTGLAERARLLDEGIDIIDALWRGDPKAGVDRYRVELTPGHVFDLRPVQQPRVPIWVVGAWLRPKSMQRILRCDGILPVLSARERRPLAPSDVRELAGWLNAQDERQYDIVIEGATPPDGPEIARATVRPLADAGATWWLEARWDLPHHSPERMRQVADRLAAGPPLVGN